MRSKIKLSAHPHGVADRVGHHSAEWLVPLPRKFSKSEADFHLRLLDESCVIACGCRSPGAVRRPDQSIPEVVPLTRISRLW